MLVFECYSLYAKGCYKHLNTLINQPKWWMLTSLLQLLFKLLILICQLQMLIKSIFENENYRKCFGLTMKCLPLVHVLKPWSPTGGSSWENSGYSGKRGLPEGSR